MHVIAKPGLSRHARLPSRRTVTRRYSGGVQEAFSLELSSHHHNLAYSTILEAVQRRGQQVQGPVDIGYQAKLQEVLY